MQLGGALPEGAQLSRVRGGPTCLINLRPRAHARHSVSEHGGRGSEGQQRREGDARARRADGRRLPLRVLLPGRVVARAAAAAAAFRCAQAALQLPAAQEAISRRAVPFGDHQATKTRKSETLRTTRRRRSTWLPNESPQPMPALCTAGGPAEASVSAPAPYARKNTQVVSLSGQSPRAKAGLPPGAWRCPWPPACQSPPPRPPAGKSPFQSPAPTVAAPPAAHPPAAAAPGTRAPPDAPGTACAPPAAMPAAPTAAPPRAPDRAAESTPRPPPSAGRAAQATAS